MELCSNVARQELSQIKEDLPVFIGHVLSGFKKTFPGGDLAEDYQAKAGGTEKTKPQQFRNAKSGFLQHKRETHFFFTYTAHLYILNFKKKITCLCVSV